MQKFSFFKFKFIYFNWRLITLQYYIGLGIHRLKRSASDWDLNQCAGT